MFLANLKFSESFDSTLLQVKSTLLDKIWKWVENLRETPLPLNPESAHEFGPWIDVVLAHTSFLRISRIETKLCAFPCWTTTYISLNHDFAQKVTYTVFTYHAFLYAVFFFKPHTCWWQDQKLFIWSDNQKLICILIDWLPARQTAPSLVA